MGEDTWLPGTVELRDEPDLGAYPGFALLPYVVRIDDGFRMVSAAQDSDAFIVAERDMPGGGGRINLVDGMTGSAAAGAGTASSMSHCGTPPPLRGGCHAGSFQARRVAEHGHLPRERLLEAPRGAVVVRFRRIFIGCESASTRPVITKRPIARSPGHWPEVLRHDKIAPAEDQDDRPKIFR